MTPPLQSRNEQPGGKVVEVLVKLDVTMPDKHLLSPKHALMKSIISRSINNSNSSKAGEFKSRTWGSNGVQLLSHDNGDVEQSGPKVTAWLTTELFSTQSRRNVDSSTLLPAPH